MSIDCDGGEYPDVFRESNRTAHLRHKCSACGEIIRPGDLYHHTFYIYDGSSNTIRRCARCEVLYRALVKLHQKEMPEVEDVEVPGVAPELDCGHDFQAVFKRDPPPELARLAFMTPDEMQAELAELAGQS